MDEKQRKQFIDDQLRARGKFIAPPNHILTPEQILAREAMSIWEQVKRNIAMPLLKAIPTPSQYQPAGTQRLLKDAFVHRFNGMSKDELVMLVSIMHAEELEKWVDACVKGGLCGPDMEKPV